MEQEPRQAEQDLEVVDIDLDLLDYLLSLTPAERMQRHDGALQLVLALRKASVAHYGFDPRTAATPDR